jgi:hypothetical protein
MELKLSILGIIKVFIAIPMAVLFASTIFVFVKMFVGFIKGAYYHQSSGAFVNSRIKIFCMLFWTILWGLLWFMILCWCAGIPFIKIII